MNPNNPQLENAIAYFAGEYQKRALRPICQTLLYKLLAMLDFKTLKETGEPAFDIEYLAMERGPVPMVLYSNRNDIQSDFFTFSKQSDLEFVITAKKKADLNYFTDDEVKEMERLIEIYSAREYGTAAIASDQSHKDIKAWRDAYARGHNSKIKYADEFSDDVYNSPEDRLTPEEDRFLIFESLKKMRSAT